jgi:hypothetical protein
MLLTDNEVRAFSEERMRPFAQQDDRFRGVSDYFTLSDVYFNQGGTLALTALSSWCGGLCAQSQWRVFEKLDAASGSSASGDRAVCLEPWLEALLIFGSPRNLISCGDANTSLSFTGSFALAQEIITDSPGQMLHEPLGGRRFRVVDRRPGTHLSV